MRATEIVLSFDKREIEALQNALDCFSDESCTVEQKLREAFDSLYTELVPPEMQNAIEKEILKENIAQQEQTEADKRFGLFHIRENNEDRYYLNEFIQQPFASAYRYRLYSQNELPSEPKRFADALLGSVPITVIDYETLPSDSRTSRKFFPLWILIWMTERYPSPTLTAAEHTLSKVFLRQQIRHTVHGSSQQRKKRRFSPTIWTARKSSKPHSCRKCKTPPCQPLCRPVWQDTAPQRVNTNTSPAKAKSRLERFSHLLCRNRQAVRK